MKVIEFRRRVDEITYSFVPTDESGGYPVWKREDRDLWLKCSTDRGWAVVDADGTVLSVPWNALPAEQGQLPPVGEWVSNKGDKSYVYDLVYV